MVLYPLCLQGHEVSVKQVSIFCPVTQMAWLNCFHPVCEHRVTKSYTFVRKKHGLNEAHGRCKPCRRDEQRVLSTVEGVPHRCSRLHHRSRSTSDQRIVPEVYNSPQACSAQRTPSLTPMNKWDYLRRMSPTPFMIHYCRLISATFFPWAFP